MPCDDDDGQIIQQLSLRPVSWEPQVSGALTTPTKNPGQFHGEPPHGASPDHMESHQIRIDHEGLSHQTSDVSTQAPLHQFYEMDLLPMISRTRFLAIQEYDYMPGDLQQKEIIPESFGDNTYVPLAPPYEMQGEVLPVASEHHTSLATHSGNTATYDFSVSANLDDAMDPLDFPLLMFGEHADSLSDQSRSPIYSPRQPLSTPSYNGSYDGSPFSNYSDFSPDPSQRMLPNIYDPIHTFGNDKGVFNPASSSSLLLVPDPNYPSGPSAINVGGLHRKVPSAESNPIVAADNMFLSPNSSLRRTRSESGFRQHLSYGENTHGHDLLCKRRHSGRTSSSLRPSPYPSPKLIPSMQLEECSKLLLPDMMTHLQLGLKKSGTGTSYKETPGHPQSNITGGIETTGASDNEGRKKQYVTTDRTAVASQKRRKQDAVFLCPVAGCGSTFTRNFNLQGHIRSHYDERPYICSWLTCHKAFARQYDCKRHERLHTNHPCESCDKEFGRMDALRKHVRLEHGAGIRKKLQLTDLAVDGEQLPEAFQQSLVIDGLKSRNWGDYTDQSAERLAALRNSINPGLVL